MDARPRGDGLLRPTRVSPAELAASTDDLRRIDMMITANEDRAQSPASAVAWMVVVTVVAGLLIFGGFHLITAVTEPRIGNIVGTAGGLLLVLGGSFSGVLCLVYLWAGVVLHRQCIRQDLAFRSALSELLTELNEGSESLSSRRTQLVDQLDAIEEGETR